tara:strand:+ start:2475 stop:3428 length:954 start_codon:yes stop_codon:yes gene_type:complete
MNGKYLLDDKKIWVAGHKGMVGSAIVRRLKSEKCQIVSVDSSDVDLTRQQEVEDWIQESRPDVVFLAAGKVGGIHANNTYPADFIYQNLMIESNVINSAAKCGVEKLLFLGSSCIYPRDIAQPMRESSLLSGALEKSNEWYAIAKIAGIKMCEAFRKQHSCDFISAMPTNLYGPEDNFHSQNSHVPAALLTRFSDAVLSGHQHVDVWGTGRVRREFLHVDDLADACVFLMTNYSDVELVNVGVGEDVSIAEFAELIAGVVGFKGEIRFDASRPEGTPRKLLDTKKINELGWKARISLKEGMIMYYKWFKENQGRLRK